MCYLTVIVICQRLDILPENGTMQHSYCHLMLIELDCNGVLLKYDRCVCYIVCVFLGSCLVEKIFFTRKFYILNFYMLKMYFCTLVLYSVE
jgi:hypothetical protein